jgi:hypothetical protein
MYLIEKNIPIVDSKNNLAAVMRSMDIGDSVVIDQKDRTKVSQYAKINGVKMKTKTIDGALRMWRIE